MLIHVSKKGHWPTCFNMRKSGFKVFRVLCNTILSLKLQEYCIEWRSDLASFRRNGCHWGCFFNLSPVIRMNWGHLCYAGCAIFHHKSTHQSFILNSLGLSKCGCNLIFCASFYHLKYTKIYYEEHVHIVPSWHSDARNVSLNTSRCYWLTD